MRTLKLYVRFAQLVEQNLNCIKANNTEWELRSRTEIHELCKSNMPHGSGIDSGTRFDLASSRPDRLVFFTNYHHMNDSGMYDGWTQHEVIVTPSLSRGFDLRITGRDRNQIKEYLHDVYWTALSEIVSF